MCADDSGFQGQDDVEYEVPAAGVTTGMVMRGQSLNLLRTLCGDGSTGEVVFVVAETGMGKTTLVNRYQKERAEDASFCRYVSLDRMASLQASQAIVRLARCQLARRDHGGGGVAIIDDIPPFDECDLTRVTVALKKMMRAGSTIVLCMRPEAMQLLEEMPESRQIRVGDLMLRDQCFEDEGLTPELIGGIPALLDALAKDRAEEREPTAIGSTYRLSLQSILAAYLRPTLPREEIDLRLAMLLLGVGSMEDVSACVARLDEEMALWQRDEAPLFGIDSQLRSFRCVGVADDEVLASVLPGVSAQCRQSPHVMRSVANLLASRGEYGRSVSIAALAEPEDRIALMAKWGVEYLCAGAVGFVREALMEVEQRLPRDPEGTDAVRSALALIELPASKLRENMLREIKGPSDYASACMSGRDHARRMRHLELLKACRDLDRGTRSGNVVLPRETDDALAQGLVEHIVARTYLLEGSLTQAYGCLVNSPHRLGGDSLVSALLSVDFEVASMLLGEEPSEGEIATFERSREFLAGLGVERLATYRSVLDQWVAAMVGRRDDLEHVERAVACASRMGDRALQACLLLGAAVCDLRGDRFPRAHVRALQALELGSWPGRYIGEAAQFVDGLSHHCLGERGPLTLLAKGSQTSPFVALAGFAVGDDVTLGSGYAGYGEGASLDHDMLWALCLLCNDLGELSESYRSRLPESWLRTLRRSSHRAESFARMLGQGESRPSAAAPRDHSSLPVAPVEVTASAKPIRICLLGDFRVQVEGGSVSPALLSRRRAGALMACLAACEGHRMSRVNIIESIWPEYAYDDALQRLYEATSRARSAVKASGIDIDPFANRRGEGVLGLDLGYVSVDIDDFVREAHGALSARGEAEVIERSARVLNLYKGDAYVSTFDARGLQAARRDELRDLLADVSVAAARSALGEGKGALATRFARTAYDVCDLREDVALALIEALRSSGRNQLAREVYWAFSKRMMERTGMPPTASMRRAVESLFPPTKGFQTSTRAVHDEVLTLAR